MTDGATAVGLGEGVRGKGVAQGLVLVRVEVLAVGAWAEEGRLVAHWVSGGMNGWMTVWMKE